MSASHSLTTSSMRTVHAASSGLRYERLAFRNRLERQAVSLARSGAIEGVICQEIAEELAEKLQEKLNQSSENVTDTLTDLLSFLRVVSITNQLHVIATDPDDDKVLECAVVGHATHIVSGDKRHILPLGTYQGILIVSPAEFLQSVANASSPSTP